MRKSYQVSIEVDQGKQLDHKFIGNCKNCKKEIYEGDTVYHYKGQGYYCVDCFMEVVINQLLETA